MRCTPRFPLRISLAVLAVGTPAAWADVAAPAGFASPAPAAPAPGYTIPAPLSSSQLSSPSSLWPPGYQPPFELPYSAGDPIPAGYRLVEEPRYGLVTAGWVLAGVTYGLGAASAVSANFRNASGFMLVPFVGPWLTLGRRDHARCSDSDDAEDGLRCVGDVFLVAGIVADGLLQAGGAAMLFSGYFSKRRKLVRGDLAWSFGPRPVGSGYGLGAGGTF